MRQHPSREFIIGGNPPPTRFSFIAVSFGSVPHPTPLTRSSSLPYNPPQKGESVQEDKILTKHPQGKNGKNIRLNDYEMFKQALISVLRGKELSQTELMDRLNERLAGKFAGNISWYGETVKLDLEARKRSWRERIQNRKSIDWFDRAQRAKLDRKHDEDEDGLVRSRHVYDAVVLGTLDRIFPSERIHGQRAGLAGSRSTHRGAAQKPSRRAVGPAHADRSAESFCRCRQELE